MNRKEKKRIRLQIIRLLDTHCSACGERNESKNSKCLTTCPIGKRMQTLSAQLEQKTSGLPIKTGKWSREEEFYLWHHQHLTLTELAEKLNRDTNVVYLKLQRLIEKGGVSNVS